MSFSTWVDKRVANAIDHVLATGQIDEVAGRVADKVADRLDESLGRIDDIAADTTRAVAQEVRTIVLNLVPDTAAVANQVVDAVRGIIPGFLRMQVREPEEGGQ